MRLSKPALRLTSVCLLAVALAFAWGGPGFVGGSLRRPAGPFVVVEHLPEGTVCRPAYGELAGRPEWDPIPQWRGEKTYHPSRELQADEHRQWYHFDAEFKILGFLARRVANVLLGKDSPLYDPIRDVGSFVVVTNCEKIRVSGKKYHRKLYFRNLSMRPGGLKVERFKDLIIRFPERILMRAVWGMMPRTPSSRRIFKERLKLFAGPNHRFYDKEPVDYPMHKIKSATVAMNIKPEERLTYWHDVKRHSVAKYKEEKKEEEEETRLEVFKEFLRSHINEVGEESVASLGLEEHVSMADQMRLKKVYEEGMGRSIPKRKVKMHLGLDLPKVTPENAGKKKWRTGRWSELPP